MKRLFVICIMLSTAIISSAQAQAIIADHRCTDIHAIPVTAIENARAELHIGYGFTSHGSQIISGMTGLTGFMNANPVGLSGFRPGSGSGRKSKARRDKGYGRPRPWPGSR